MIQPGQLTRSARSAPGFAPVVVGAGRETLVVAADALIAEALAVALSACGISARAAVALPWRLDDRGLGGGTALVVLGGFAPDAARRTVAALVAAGRRVALVAGPDLDPALGECVAAGAEVIVAEHGSLSAVATLMNELGGEGPVHSPIDLDGARFGSRPVPGEIPGLQARLGLLTDRESQVLTALIAGRRASQIADDHFVSLHTVRTQIRSLLRKLEVHSQVEAVAVAHQAGWSPDTRRR